MRGTYSLHERIEAKKSTLSDGDVGRRDLLVDAKVLGARVCNGEVSVRLWSLESVDFHRVPTPVSIC